MSQDFSTMYRADLILRVADEILSGDLPADMSGRYMAWLSNEKRAEITALYPGVPLVMLREFYLREFAIEEVAVTIMRLQGKSFGAALGLAQDIVTSRQQALNGRIVYA